VGLLEFERQRLKHVGPDFGEDSRKKTPCWLAGS